MCGPWSDRSSPTYAACARPDMMINRFDGFIAPSYVAYNARSLPVSNACSHVVCRQLEKTASDKAVGLPARLYVAALTGRPELYLTDSGGLARKRNDCRRLRHWIAAIR